MLSCFTTSAPSAISIIPVITDQFNTWLEKQNTQIKTWVNTVNFIAKPESFCLIPGADGKIASVLIGIKDAQDFWSFGHLSTALPPQQYTIENATVNFQQIALAWGLGSYQFTRYKQSTKTIAQLLLPEKDAKAIENIVTSIFLVRDLINTPTEDMGPAELAQAAEKLAKEFKAEFSQITGDDLLKNNYPTIHAVGRASTRLPRLIDIHWGDANAPKITLVGKGVCFDTGGLDIKPASGMALMKKDMAGAAHVLGLARMIMAAKLPVRLRVLIPAVENVIAGNAFKPGDVITTRKGLTVEVTNTDAEGRLILCDALAEASTENPDILIDIATLTGAARVAVGTDISAMFANQAALAQQILKYAEQENDPTWQLPLYTPYRKWFDSAVADMANSSSQPYGGAITAALFLKEYVAPEIAWAHFDIMAWNVSSRPGRPEGGEAMAIRAIFRYLADRFK